MVWACWKGGAATDWQERLMAEAGLSRAWLTSLVYRVCIWRWAASLVAQGRSMGFGWSVCLRNLAGEPYGSSCMMTLLFPNKRRNKIRNRKNTGGWEILNIRGGGGKLWETIVHGSASYQTGFTDCSLCWPVACGCEFHVTNLGWCVSPKPFQAIDTEAGWIQSLRCLLWI